MIVGITGGAGFIGSNLARFLLDQGYEISILDDLSTGLLSNLNDLNLDFSEGSITNPDLVLKWMKPLDHVVHLAARGSVPRSIKNPLATYQVNTFGTFNVLEAARHLNKPVIFSSSSSVYGANPSLPKHERDWTQPITPYAASKLAGEALMTSYASSYGMRILTLRFFNVFGPWQRPDHIYAAVIPKWLWSAIDNKPLDVYGDGTQTRDFTFVSLPCQVISQYLDSDNRIEGPVNLALGKKIALSQLIDFIKVKFPQVEINFVNKRPGDILHSLNDPKTLLDHFPRLVMPAFTDAVEKTLDWMLQNRNHFSRIENDQA